MYEDDPSNMLPPTSRVRRRRAVSTVAVLCTTFACVQTDVTAFSVANRATSRGAIRSPPLFTNYFSKSSPVRRSDGSTRRHSVPWDVWEQASGAFPVVSDVMHSASSLFLSKTTDVSNFLPFSELGRELSQSLDIGSNLSRNVGNLPETTTGLVLESLGYDLLVFLAASVFVTPICRFMRITPILGYLIIGALLGPHGLDVFANSKADVELGDFGILFLLFSEGLEVTTPRLRKLANFLPLG